MKAPYFDGANLLIAADCTAYAYGNFHNRFIKNHITLIGCPKLDEGDYTQKLTEIIRQNNIKSVTIVRDGSALRMAESKWQRKMRCRPAGNSFLGR